MAKHRLTRPSYARPRARRNGLLAAIVVVLALVLSGCDWSDKVTEPFRDAPRDRTFDNKADVLTMPDGFSNMATKCGPGGMRYTVAYHGDSAYAAISVVADPTCPK
jgi:hypothetical protein